MTKNFINYFDRLEDRTRARLSRYPIVYALLGGVGIVLFWRGVWHTADLVMISVQNLDIDLIAALDSIMSFAVGTMILLLTGVFVSSFIGSRLIITGLSGEKKLTEKTKDEIFTEEDQIQSIQKTLDRVEKKIEKIENEIEK